MDESSKSEKEVIKEQGPSFTREQKIKYDVRHFPVRPHVGVGGVIKWKDYVVLIKRKYNPNAGKWAIPGGHLKLGEKVQDGALRECEEETGLKLIPKGLASVIDKIDFSDDGRIEYHYVLIDFFFSIKENKENPFTNQNLPKPIAQSDALDARLVPIKSLNKYDLTTTVVQLFRDLGLL